MSGGGDTGGEDTGGEDTGGAPTVAALIGALAAARREQSARAVSEAQLLLAQVLGRSRAWISAHPEAAVAPEAAARFAALAERVLTGEPLPYLLGEWEFFGLPLIVTPAVLIPRPETELLVEQALGWLARHPAARLAVDVGTGSGAIPLALGTARPVRRELRLLGSDRSRAALRVAHTNRTRHGLTAQLDLVQADLLPPLAAPIDLLTANLPYIPRAALDRLAVARWEPRLALDGGADGLDLIRRALVQAVGALAPVSLLLFEIEEGQGAAVRELAGAAFLRAEVRVLPDLSGRERLLWVSQG
jgi:release factor glutamine methyltransferase